MKPFNLESALAGNPVRLRNGAKAFVLADVTKLFEWHDTTKYPLKGVVSSVSSSNEYVCSEHWTKDGSNQSEYFDIIGMWEEPELTQEQILEKAYSENLKVTFDKAIFKTGYEVAAKTKDGEYILKSPAGLSLAKSYRGIKIYEEKPSTSAVTVTLPRPFKPRLDDTIYFIHLNQDGGFPYVASNYNVNPVNLPEGGIYFRAREDAQAWLDAMKEAER